MFTTQQTFTVQANAAKEARAQIKAATTLGFKVERMEARGTWDDGTEDTIDTRGTKITNVSKGRTCVLDHVDHEVNVKARPIADSYAPGCIHIKFIEAKKA